MVEGFRREDPPAIPQLAVPILVPNQCYKAGLLSNHSKLKRAGCLTMVAFYYLLRVGEYTKPRYCIHQGKQVRATRTQQFCVRNVGFFKDGKIVPRSSPISVLLTCDSATLKITNQKNGRMGETIHQEATGTDLCPIQALAHIVSDILSNGGSEDSLLCDIKNENDCWEAITSKDIVDLVRVAATALNLKEQAIDPDLLGSHSLRAGGAMALKLHGEADTTIKKMGRWTSLTFLQYIHNQIAHLSKDMSKKMSMPLPFLNIAAIEGAA